MVAILRTKTALLFFVFLLVESVIGMAFFGLLLELTSDYKQSIQMAFRNEENGVSEPVSTSQSKIIESPNGTKDYVFIFYESVGVHDQGSANIEYIERFTYSAHVLINYAQVAEENLRFLKEAHEKMLEFVIAFSIILSGVYGLNKIRFLS